jgi:hypothetical protein
VTTPPNAARETPVLDYRKSAVPRVERGPGYARLVMPPVPPQKRVAGLVGTVVLALISFAFVAVDALVAMRGDRSMPSVLKSSAWILGTGLASLVAVVVVATWFVKQSYVAPQFEFSDGSFTRLRPGVVRSQTIRTPLADVVSVAASERRAARVGSLYFVDVTVVVRPARRVSRWFLAPTTGVAAAFEDAFNAVLASRDAADPPLMRSVRRSADS